MANYIFTVFCFALLCSLGFCQDPNYDHQTKTYNAQFRSVTVNNKVLTVTPYFSPDTSIDVETALILSAKKTIDIAIPSVGSWSECECSSYYNGCTVEKQRYNESFPIFAAVLNAVNSGVSVRLVTNLYPGGCPDGNIDILGFWALAGVQVRYYTSTTFVHAKYIQVDKKKASVSSVNFSKTSFMKNREAGVIIEGANATPLLQFLDQVFNYDFANGGAWPTQSYTSSQMRVIKDKSLVPIPLIEHIRFDNAYVTQLQPVTDTMTFEIFTSPDFAHQIVMNGLSNATSSFHLFIYQVTEGDLCDIIPTLNNLGDFKMLVSSRIFDKADYESAKKCYEKLEYDDQINFRKTAANMYTFSHNKFWILDYNTVYMSTGNWGTSDYPDGPNTYPPYSAGSAWRKINRDFTVRISHSGVAAQFEKVLSQDYDLGTKW